MKSRHIFGRAMLVAALSYCAAVPAKTPDPKAEPDATAPRKAIDHSGKKKKGKASYYGPEFTGKTMADGTPFDPESNAAASKTLPLGTKARVKNLRTGKSVKVKIKDRGPYVKGRIIDVTPKTAKKLGIKKDGVAPVEVIPIEVPQPDGSVKPGAGAKDEPDKSAADGKTGKPDKPDKEDGKKP